MLDGDRYYLRNVDENGLKLSRAHSWFTKEYFRLIVEFLEDPKLSEEYALDGTRFATAALCCLKYICDHRSKPIHASYAARKPEIRRNLPWIWRKQKMNNGLPPIKQRLRPHKKWFLKGGKKLDFFYSEIYYFALNCLPYLLSRSENSKELVDYVTRHTFAPRSQELRRATNRARRAITEYLGQTG
jgi:hypothetical protein